MVDIVAAVARTPREQVELAPLRLSSPRDHELVVEVRAAGICHSDLSGRDQLMPFPLPGVLGHEGAGTVVEVGSAVTSVGVGDRIVMSQAFCGDCAPCRAGRVTACTLAGLLSLSGARRDGSPMLTDHAGRAVSGGFLGQSSWATHALVREPNIVRLADDVPWEVAAPMACGVQTGAGAVLNVLRPSPSDSVVVFGAGTVGLSAVMAAKAAGCVCIVAVDPHPGRLTLAEELGASHALDPRVDDILERLRTITDGGADFVIEASGARVAGGQAVQSMSRSGTCMLLGVPPFGTPLEVDWVGLVSGQTILGVPYGGGTPSGTIDALLEMRSAGALPIEKLVTTYAFADLEVAIADMESGAVLKPVLLFD